jgi:beta-glucosidase
VTSAPGESAEVTVEIPRRAFETWTGGEGAEGSWSFVKGSYEIQIGRSITDRRLTATINV